MFGDNMIKLVAKDYYARATKLDLNAMVVVAGEMGSGKSSLALKIAETLAEMGMEFHGVKDIYFDLEDLKEALLTARYRVLVVDEAGVQLFSRDYMKEANKEIAKIAQMVRFRNSVIIWTVPHFGFIDKAVRLMMHHIWKTRKTVKWENGEPQVTRQAMVYHIVTDYISSRIRLEPITIYLNGEPRVFPWITWSMPNKKLWEEYQREKEKFWRKQIGRKKRWKNAVEFVKWWIEQGRPFDVEAMSRESGYSKGTIHNAYSQFRNYDNFVNQL